MGVKFFGQFLVERGVIDREQLLACTRLQDERNRPLGSIAVEKGYLSVEQAARINRAQQTTDRRFGELALELGLLTDAQIEEVLTLQRASRIRIGEALVELGSISAAQVEKELSAFQADQAMYQTGPVDLPANTPSSELVSVCIDLTEKLLLRVGGLTGKRGAVIARAIEAPAPELLTIRIPFFGSAKAQYTISTSRDVAFSITRRILGSAITLSDELALDALKEFCNIVCGNVCGKLSRSEKPLEIGPPEEGLPATHTTEHALLVPLHLPEGQFELRIYLDRA